MNFQETENDAYYVKLSDHGKSIRENINPGGIYYVVTDSYSADYTYNNMTVIDTYENGSYARDLRRRILCKKP